MKKIVSFALLTVSFIFFLASCAPTKEDAMDYNDKIIREQKKVVKCEKDLINAIKMKFYEDNTIDDLLNDLSKQIDGSKKIVEEMEDFDGKTDFKDAALKFFAAYREVVDKEYTAWLENMKTPAELVTGAVLHEEKKLINAINRKLDKATNDFLDAQKDFAAKYDFKLLGSEVDPCNNDEIYNQIESKYINDFKDYEAKGIAKLNYINIDYIGNCRFEISYEVYNFDKMKTEKNIDTGRWENNNLKIE